jgi:DNA primase
VSIPQAFLQELLARVDIVEVVGRHVALKKGGANFLGLCPFHDEKSPSFTVSPTKQFFHCFGCGKSGSALGFLMEHTGAGFIEAVQDLAQQAGLSVPQDEETPEQRAQASALRRQRSSLSELLEQAAQAYQQQLKGAPQAVDYLKRRGLSGQIAKQYGIGYAPGQWRFLSTAVADYQNPLLVEAGLVIEAHAAHEAGADAAATQESGSGSGRSGKRYDRFRDRIMFPIRNVKGQCIGFGGRVLGAGEPKYLNSPETPLFSKGRELYGLFEARSAIRHAGCVLVTEGYMDVVALAQHGLGYAVATLGTACTPEQVRLLFRFSDTVVFAFDGDSAGRRAARKALPAALPWVGDRRSVKFLFLPPEHDPDSYIRAHGAQAFEQALAQALPLSRFLLDVAAEGCALDTPEGRARLASQAEPLWSALPEGAFKHQMLLELADRVALDGRDLLALWQPKPPHASKAPRRVPARTAADPTHPRRGPSNPPYPPYPATTAAAAALELAPRARPRDLEPPSAGARGSAIGAGFAPLRAQRPHRRTPRGLLGRADRVARIVLAASQAWDWLSADDHQLLAQQPAPHGALFAWLEGQWLEHGPQPWAAVREALRGQAFEALALELHSGGMVLEQAEAQTNTPAEAVDPTDPSGVRSELRELLRLLHIERLMQIENELIAHAETDAGQMQRYREVTAQRKILQNSKP